MKFNRNARVPLRNRISLKRTALGLVLIANTKAARIATAKLRYTSMFKHNFLLTRPVYHEILRFVYSILATFETKGYTLISGIKVPIGPSL